MSKARDAFRTISEVSDELDTPAHVLRFWESKFNQVKPVKRAGGRRYYRPADLDLLAGIKKLLHDDGMTIKGAQKLLREQGVKHVSALGAESLKSDIETAGVGEDDAIDAVTSAPDQTPAPEARTEPEAKPDDAEPAAATEPEIDSTNIVTLPSFMEQSDADGPAEALDPTSAAKPDEKEDPELALATPDPTPPTEEAVPEKEPEQVAAPEPQVAARKMPDFPADPSDNDSKAPARLFNHLNRASHAGLAAQAGRIAPLLDRMQVLRDRINLR